MTDTIHIVLAMKPIEGNFSQNAQEHGVAGLNIDGCRISLGEETPPSGSAKRVYKSNQYTEDKTYGDNKTTPESGRFPANVIHDGSDEVEAEFPETGKSAGGGRRNSDKFGGGYAPPGADTIGLGDEGTAARYFKECKLDD